MAVGKGAKRHHRKIPRLFPREDSVQIPKKSPACHACGGRAEGREEKYSEVRSQNSEWDGRLPNVNRTPQDRGGEFRSQNSGFRMEWLDFGFLTVNPELLNPEPRPP